MEHVFEVAFAYGAGFAVGSGGVGCAAVALYAGARWFGEAARERWERRKAEQAWYAAEKAELIEYAEKAAK